MTFLQEAWYLAAWAEEIGSDTLLARRIAGMAVVMLRKRNGLAAALRDRCPHRFAPLSLGTKQGDQVVCRYHGLTFDSSGACVHNPHGPVTSALSVDSYPCVERHEAIWLWLGPASKADPALIPDLSFIDATPATAKVKGYMPTAAGYDLCSDNILDLSHADYLHPDTLGGGSMTRAKGKITEGDRTVSIDWSVVDDVAPPALAMHLPDPKAPADVWSIVTWHPPGVMVLEAGAAPASCAREDGVNTFNVHVMTPETAVTTHYFYCNTRNFLRDDAAMNQFLAGALATAFGGEDKPMLEGQQARLEGRSFQDLKPALLPIDAGGVAVRRRMRTMLDRENAGAGLEATPS